MAQYLKESKPEGEKAAEDTKVRTIVASALVEIEQGGDKAVRDLSEKFDNYRPVNFRLSLAEIKALISELSESYTIAIVTHSMQQAARVSHRTAYFHLGRLVEMNDTETVFTKPEHDLTEAYITGRFG